MAISQSLDSRQQQLEVRVAVLEEEIARLKSLLSNKNQASLPNKNQTSTPSWMVVVGSLEDDPTFDEANQLGKEWRTSSDV